MRYLSDPQLRQRTTAATNKVESYNNFSAWCRFGNEGRVRDNDPVEQEKQIKFALLTNAVIFRTTLDMMSVLRQLATEGWEITPADLEYLHLGDLIQSGRPGRLESMVTVHQPVQVAARQGQYPP